MGRGNPRTDVAIVQASKRNVTYDKRVQGLVKKAAQLSAMTRAEVTIFITPENHNRRPVVFSSVPDWRTVPQKYDESDACMLIGTKSVLREGNWLDDRRTQAKRCKVTEPEKPPEQIFTELPQLDLSFFVGDTHVRVVQKRARNSGIWPSLQ